MGNNDQYKYDAYYAKSLKKISPELFSYLSSINSEHPFELIKSNVVKFLRKLKNPINDDMLLDEKIVDISTLHENTIKRGNSAIVNELCQHLLKTDFGKNYNYYLRCTFPHIVHENNKSWLKMNEHVSRDVTKCSQHEVFLKYYLVNSLEILIGLGIVLNKNRYKNCISINKEQDSVTVIAGYSKFKFFIKNDKLFLSCTDKNDLLIRAFLFHSPIFDKHSHDSYKAFLTNVKHDDVVEVILDDYFFKGISQVKSNEELSLEEVISSVRLSISNRQVELGNVNNRAKTLRNEISLLESHLENIVKASVSIDSVKKYIL